MTIILTHSHLLSVYNYFFVSHMVKNYFFSINLVPCLQNVTLTRKNSKQSYYLKFLEMNVSQPFLRLASQSP